MKKALKGPGITRICVVFSQKFTRRGDAVSDAALRPPLWLIAYGNCSSFRLGCQYLIPHNPGKKAMFHVKHRAASPRV